MIELIKKVKRRLTVDNLGRKFLADRYITGTGIEIGALHDPLPVDKTCARVKFVDRMSVDELRLQYPELREKKLVEVDYIADGELLESVLDASQDFVIANHFIEHCQNPILTIKNMLRVLKPSGIIFMAVPDKRFTFDKLRSPTPIAHLIDDYENGPTGTRVQHFREWVIALNNTSDENFIAAEMDRLMSIDYSIHFHVWNKTNFDELLAYLITKMGFDFEIEVSFRAMNSVENIYILRKTSN